jgi:hypothetical protein
MKRIYKGSMQDTNVEPGTLVRLAVRADPKERMKRLFKKKGYDVQYKNALYTVKKHYKPRAPMSKHTPTLWKAKPEILPFRNTTCQQRNRKYSVRQTHL